MALVTCLLLGLVMLALPGCGESAEEIEAAKVAQRESLRAVWEPIRDQHIKATTAYLAKQREVEQANLEVRRLKAEGGNALAEAKAKLAGMGAEYAALGDAAKALKDKRDALEAKMSKLGWEPVLLDPDAVGGTPRPEGS